MTPMTRSKSVVRSACTATSGVILVIGQLAKRPAGGGTLTGLAMGQVRHTWNARHCKQQRNTAIAATGRPL
jgi:hypothetical protein